MLNEQQLEDLHLDRFQKARSRLSHVPDIALDNNTLEVVVLKQAESLSDQWTQ